MTYQQRAALLARLAKLFPADECERIADAIEYFVDDVHDNAFRAGWDLGFYDGGRKRDQG